MSENTAPAANSISESDVGGQVQTFTISDIITKAGNAGSLDADGDTVTLQSFAGQAVTSGTPWGSNLSTANGTLAFDGTTFTYTPNAGFYGVAESISYVLSDGTDTATGTATISITPAETQVNTNATLTDVVNNTTHHPHNAGAESDVTALSDGGWLVTWANYGLDGSSYGVFAQRFSADGSTYGPEFQVNTQTLHGQYQPTALELSNGDIIIAYAGNTAGYSGNYAQRFDSNMIAKGNEFQLNETSSNYPGEPELIDLGGGKFGVSYRIEGSGVANTHYSDIFYREFSAANVGNSQTVVNTNNYMQHQNEPDVAISGSNVVVVWSETSGSITNGIYGRVYDTGTPAWGTDFAISINGAGRNARIETLNDGRFVVTWQATGVDGSSTGIQGHFLTAAGVPTGSEFSINTTTTGVQSYSDIAVTSDGGFIVTWHGQGDNSSNTSDYGIWAQRFDSSGTKIGSEISVNSQVDSGQVYPDITVLSDGDFIITWSDESKSETNANVMMQRYNSDGSVHTDAIPLYAPPEISISGSSASFTVGQNFDGVANYRDVKLADVDGDGDLDAIMADNNNNQTVVRLNDGNGNFGTANVVFASNGDLIAADFNGDGKADFASASGGVYLSDGDGTFTAASAVATGDNVGAADIDGDGDVDLVIVSNSGDKIYKNDGAGNFTDTGHATDIAGQEIGFGDFDLDGDLDMVVGDGGGKFEIWSNDGTGAYTKDATLNLVDANSNAGSQTYDVEVADFNGDGLLDIWTTNRYAGNMLLTNDGAGNLTFTNSGTFGLPNDREGSSSGDLDGDGDIDVVTERWDGETEIWINDGTGNFTDLNSSGTLTTATQHAQNSDIGDVNGDGLNDIFLANVSNNSEVLLNGAYTTCYSYSTDASVNPLSGLTITDVDSTNMSRVRIDIENYSANDNWTVVTPGSLTVNIDTTNGVIEIYGDATIAEYQTALQSITYTNTSVTSDESRLLQVTLLDDKGQTAKVGVTLNLLNTDPLVIDLDGDGVELVSASDGVQFDANVDGQKEQIGWAGKDDAILVYDVNKDGAINDMSEVVSHYFSYQGRNAEQGLDSSHEVLALYDDNADGKIDANDEIYNGLSIWQDANGDGITDDGELRTLKSEGIEAIDLGYDAVEENLEGNQISKKGSVEYQDGTTQQWNEVNFDIESNASNLFNEVVQPLLDEDELPAVSFEVIADNSPDEDQNEVSDPVSLLKEIVGPTMDVQLPDAEAPNEMKTTITDAENTSDSSSAPVSEESESYTSVPDIDDAPVVHAAQ